MTRDTLSMVCEWHEAFDVPVRSQPELPPERIQMRLAIFEEEVAELRAAAPWRLGPDFVDTSGPEPTFTTPANATVQFQQSRH